MDDIYCERDISNSIPLDNAAIYISIYAIPITITIL
jgi:hypothetical protein